MRYTSQPQVSFIASLLASREVAPTLALRASSVKADVTPMSEASGIIDSLKACGWKPKAVAGSPTMGRNTVPAAIGFYRRGDNFYSIVSNKAKTRSYAKVFSHEMWRDAETGEMKGPGWKYTPGMVFDLRVTEKVTLEEAVEFGKVHGRCLICGRTLTVKKSILAGIGPVCITKLM